jgi:hypothetical protein
MVKGTQDIWHKEFEPLLGPIASFCADGDSTNAKTHGAAGLENSMPEGELRSKLEPLLLISLTSNEHLTFSNTDDQHNGKSHRAKLGSNSGFTLDITKFVRTDLVEVVSKFTEIAPSTLENYWPPRSSDDHQNVGSMVKGFAAIAELEGLSISDLKVLKGRGRVGGVRSTEREYNLRRTSRTPRSRTSPLGYASCSPLLSSRAAGLFSSPIRLLL